MVGRIFFLTGVAGLLLTESVLAEGHYSIDVRAALLSSRSAPQREIVASGAQLRRHLSQGWFVGAAVDSLAITFDGPTAVLGLERTSSTKASLSRLAVSAHLGRGFRIAGERWRGLWSLGLGAALPNSTRTTGFRATGEYFDVQVEADTEVHLLGSLGVTYVLTPRLSIEILGRLEHHFLSQTFQDAESGVTRDFRSQTPAGVQMGISYAF